MINTGKKKQSGCWRPTLDDVERISWGQPAKQKGTGSRGVPHRLNTDERIGFDLARQLGFLQVSGSAWRSQRRDAPLLNTYRSQCDAKAHVCIVLHKTNTAGGAMTTGTVGANDEFDPHHDQVVVDLSPFAISN
jgi:hypothetical protein